MNAYRNLTQSERIFYREGMIRLRGLRYRFQYQQACHGYFRAGLFGPGERPALVVAVPGEISNDTARRASRAALVIRLGQLSAEALTAFREAVPPRRPPKPLPVPSLELF